MYDFLYLENNWLPYSTCFLLVLAPINFNTTFIRYFCFDLRSVRLRLFHNLPPVGIFIDSLSTVVARFRNHACQKVSIEKGVKDCVLKRIELVDICPCSAPASIVPGGDE